jgi:phosphoglycolate phosphatase
METQVKTFAATHCQIVLFDFDGTLSLIRSGWVEVMVPMMVEFLAATGTSESEAELTRIAAEFVARLTGKQTVYQMIELAEQVQKRGGTPLDPLAYKKIYLDRLHVRIQHRLQELESGSVNPDRYLVPGSRALLERLRERGLVLYLASGTDEPLVKREADLLDVSRYFDGGVFGALDDYKSFSKRILIERVLTASGLPGSALLGFGDGYVEIQNVKDVGGAAVGVATDEPECLRVDEWKRDRLAKVGADVIVPNFLGLPQLEERLFGHDRKI